MTTRTQTGETNDSLRQDVLFLDDKVQLRVVLCTAFGSSFGEMWKVKKAAKMDGSCLFTVLQRLKSMGSWWRAE